MTQASLDFGPPPFAPAPPLWSPTGELLLPNPVRLLALWQPYCGLVAAGVKTLETRTWEWPYPPGWLALYATLGYGGGEAFRRLGDLADPHKEPRGVVLCIVYVGGCRPMRPEDATAACVDYDPARFVWGLTAAHRLARPIPLDRGPQKFASLPRTSIAAALDPPTTQQDRS